MKFGEGYSEIRFDNMFSDWKEFDDESFKEMFSKEEKTSNYLLNLSSNFQQLQISGLKQKQEEIDWELKENGVSYNIYNDTHTIRKWNLDPIPFVLTEDEWLILSKGLIQRVKLFDRILKDIYGEQVLLKKGILPPEILYLDTHFIREVYGYASTYFDLSLYAVDLSRGPDGKFWIISDKTEAPSGLGYAIENRLTMQSIMNEFMTDVPIYPITTFIEGFKASLMHASSSKNPFVIMLSPGPYNETYFEHSYLSALLGCELVKGEDLLVQDTYIYLKTLSGLKKVDIIIRRVDDHFCDPLELRNDSQLGVAGLLEVLREGHVKMINPIGAGILENLGLNPFLNSICEYFFDEPLLLPQIATWWCGQEKERSYVLKNLDKLIIKSIDKRDPNSMFIGEDMNKKSLLSLKQEIISNPYKYVAQEHIEFSSIPSLGKNEITAKKNSIRLFCYKNNEKYHVMKGGLTRISSDKDSFIVSNQHGGGSKDLWIVSDTKIKQVDSFDLIDPFHESTFASIVTKRAENIYWLARYLKRSILTARFIRINVKYLLNRHIEHETMDLFLKALTHLTMTYPGFLSDEPILPQSELMSLIHDVNRPGTLSFTLSLLSNTHLNIKDQFSNEAKKVFDKLEEKCLNNRMKPPVKLLGNVENLDEILIYLSAYKELTRESISKEDGLVFYQIGSKVEMFIILISKIRSLLTVPLKRKNEQVALEFILAAHESYSAYRSYYKANLRLEPVLEFLLFQKRYTNSLSGIIEGLLHLISQLRELDKMQSRFFSSIRYLHEIKDKFESTALEQLLETSENIFIYDKFDLFLNDTSSLMNEFSQEFTKNYFSHYYE